jgi:hypothetical protein
VKSTTTIMIFNEVETKDLFTVRHSSTSNKGLLLCDFDVCRQPSPSRSEASARKNVDVVRDWDLQSSTKYIETF